MDRDDVRANWLQIKPSIRQHWPRLEEHDVVSINGSRAAFLACLQQRYGYAQADAERELDAWLKTIKPLWAA
jgi:uncharacterized protein YjbJ (UPF0337 family)